MNAPDEAELAALYCEAEDVNTVRLSHAEWNELVRLIKTGQRATV